MVVVNKNLDRRYFFFDIETSKIKTNVGTTVPHTFLTCLLEYDLIENKEVKTVFNRTIKEALENIAYLKDDGFYNIIYVHNLNYEYRFIFNTLVNLGKEIDFENSLFTSSTSPIKVKIKGISNVEFRCSYALLSESVATLGKRLNCPKLDYNYNKVRLATDKLEEIDYQYNKTDCLIVAKAIAEGVKEGRFDHENIPLTKTSIVRKGKLEFIDKYYKYNSNGKKTETMLKNLKNRQLFNEDFYKLLLNNFKGGLVGNNLDLTNKMVTEVYSVDRKSAYPAVMFEKYPLFTLGNNTTRLLTGSNANLFIQQYMAKKNCYHFIGTFRIKNLKAKVDNIVLPISNTDKVDACDKDIINPRNMKLIRPAKHAVIYNGKIKEAEELYISLNELDLDSINKCYSYDSIECNKVYISYKQRYLPECETSYVLSKFAAKEAIKDHDSPIRKSAKVDLNSIFGEKVMKQIFPTWSLSENGFTIKENSYLSKGLTAEERSNIFNEFLDNKEEYSKNFNLYSDGIWITSYARKELVDMQLGIVENGGTVIYVDTDSVKFTVPNEEAKAKVFKFIDEVNNKSFKKNNINPNFIEFKSLISDEDISKEILGKKITKEDWNKILNLGQWQIENHIKTDGTIVPYKYFKSLGSKKYAYTTNIDDTTEVIKTVVAGCSTKLGTVLTEYANNNDYNNGFVIDSIFKPNTLFVPEVAGRTVAEVTNPYDAIFNELTTIDGTVLENEFGGLLINDSTYLLDIEHTTNKSLYDLDALDKQFQRSYIKPDIFTGTEIIRTTDIRYNSLFETLKENIYEN